MSAHYFLDSTIALLCSLAGYFLFRRLPRFRPLVVFAVLMMWVQVALSTSRIANLFHPTFVHWARCLGLSCGALLLYGAVVQFLLSRVGAFSPSRRKVLQTGVVAAASVPVGLGTFAFLRRNDIHFREVNLKVAGLPKDLDGLRIAQVTDIHFGPFIDDRTLARVVGMANEAKPHLAFVTGDLITTKGDPLDKCIEHIAGLRADAGVWGCLGNHERYALAENYTDKATRRVGVRMLRHESTLLHFGSASVNVAGVDYQRKGTPYLPGAEHLTVPDAYNILLSHSPDVFGVSSKQGWDLTVSGHTHGGQVTFEVLHPALNIARFYTPWVHGLYEENGKQIYVSRGVGTIGVPARLGAPPEVVLLRLCAI